MIKFGLYGSGWRSEYFLRVAKFSPEQFQVDGVITTNPEKAEYFMSEYGVASYKTLDEYLQVNNPLFMVESVNKSVSAEITMQIVEHGIPVLMETPAGKDIPTMIELSARVAKGAKIQIAEQYPFHPLHTVRKSLIADGRLGDVQHAQVAFSHGYHGIALIRHYLGLGFEQAEITATSFPVMGSAIVGRDGEPTAENISASMQTVATLKFANGQTAIYNFEMGQHRSWIRTPIIHIKGNRGELLNETLKYLVDFQTPIETEIRRVNLGENQNVEGYGFKGLLVGDKWYYRNPYQNSRLVDDEIAVATALAKMAYYVHTGVEFYSFADGCQDMYLGMMIDQAVETGTTVKTEMMPWVK